MRLRAISRQLLRYRLLRSLRPYFRKLIAVTQPAGQIRLLSLADAQPSEAFQALTAISANLCHDWPRYRKLLPRLEAFARLVEAQQADLVLLQEVARTPDLQVDEWLAQRLGMAFAYSRANGHAAVGFEEGLAVFSRFPIGEPVLRDLGRACNPFSRRLALGAAVETPHGPLMVFSAHLGLLPGQNAAQLDHLRAWVAELAGDQPALVGGDFNAHETSPQIDQARRAWLDTFRALNPLGDGATHELRFPWGGVLRKARLDYLFLRPGRPRWQVLEARHLDSDGLPHSDHRAVLTRLAPVLA
jgi:endonuclease/exonuclease/phosphatase family metal-dependent hydrolase